MRIPKEVVETIWKNHSNWIYRRVFQDGEDEAIDIYGTGVLRANGEIYVVMGNEITDDLTATEYRNPTRLIAVSSRWSGLPELRAALPLRPETAATCPTCAGSGFTGTDSEPEFFVCFDCDGLGWLAS